MQHFWQQGQKIIALASSLAADTLAEFARVLRKLGSAEYLHHTACPLSIFSAFGVSSSGALSFGRAALTPFPRWFASHSSGSLVALARQDEY